MALLYFLSKVASQFECKTIWGEATPSSCSFYKRLWELEDVQDLILAPRENAIALINRVDSDQLDPTNPENARFRQEVYDVEVENTPFVGSGAAVSSPTRRLAYRFIDLPTHEQQEIIETLGLVESGDEDLPQDEKRRLAFRRASQAEKLAEFWREVERRHSDGKPEENPFRTP
jgi:hypothetical protein